MASGGYVIFNINKVKSWTLVSDKPTGKIDGIYKRLTNTEKPILIHNLKSLVIPDSAIDFSLRCVDFFAPVVEQVTDDTHGEGIYIELIDMSKNIYVYEDDTIQIG